MRVVFLGSPPFATRVFERLLAAANHDVVALATKPDKPLGRGKKIAASPLAALARPRGIEVLQPASAREPSFVARLRELAPDIAVVASYGEILRAELLALPKHGCWNVHASLLPRWRGASPIQAALLAGDAETGVSIQRMVLALDEGDVVLEKRTRIESGENSGTLLARLADIGAEALVEALDSLAAGRANFAAQDAKRATYCRKIRKEDGLIDWNASAIELERRVRAFTPWPLARAGAPNGADLSITAAVARPRDVDAAPGELLDARAALLVACGEGALELARVKPAGKGEMTALDWSRGARVEVGDRFTTLEAR